MTRDQESTAQRLPVHPYGVAQALRDRHWEDAAIAVDFASKEIPTDLAITDPALYRTLRDAVTTFYPRGGGALDLEKLRQLAARSS